MLENALRLTPLFGFRTTGVFAVGDIFGGQKNPAERLFMTR